jgi:hypothetical protein
LIRRLAEKALHTPANPVPIMMILAIVVNLNVKKRILAGNVYSGVSVD